MECFNDLLFKLREVHEREVEGWQVKVQELSNKKGCDIKRMEELFARNQQMKEQQRLLTENIKTLENRLRAGLCDRCTVTQDVANRRQQEFEASQLQTLQHISLMAGEMNNLKKENKNLKEEIRNLRAALESHNDHSSNSSGVTEIKPNSSPGISTCPGPVTLVSAATNRASNQPSDGDSTVKAEKDQRSEETEHRQMRGGSRSHYESYKSLPLSTLTLPSWRTEHGVTRERRGQSIERLDQRSSMPPQAVVLKNSSSSSTSEEINPSRHVLHTPVPCRPQPIKNSLATWPMSESSDWVSVAAAGTSQLMQPSSKLNLPRFPNLVPINQHANPRKQVFGPTWSKPSNPQLSVKEPTMVFRLRSLPEHVDSQIKPQEKKEIQTTKPERVSGEGPREIYDGPLDLSDRGKSKSSETPRDDSPSALQGGERVQRNPDKDVNTNTYSRVLVSSPSPVMLSSSSSSTPSVNQQEEEPTSDHNHKQLTEDQEQKEEVNGKTDQNNKKKVPVLTISLRPVVVLETLNSALQKQEALSSNGKSSSLAVEPESDSDNQVEDSSASGQESNQGSKRKRPAVETETDQDSDTDNIQHERKIKITVKKEEMSP